MTEPTSTWLVTYDDSPANRGTRWLVIEVPEGDHGAIVARAATEDVACRIAHALAADGDRVLAIKESEF